MKQDMLKEQLIKIKENDYDLLEGMNLNEISSEMLDNIGHTDPELRDDLIFTTFYFWIIQKKYYTNEELKEMFNIILDKNHLFYNIGSNGDDSVLTRSFSILTSALFVNRQINDHFLNEEELNEVKVRILQYVQEEKDYRGYIGENGWAHAIAHSGDTLDELAQCRSLNNEDLLRILDVIKSKITIDSYAYVNDEDERLITAVVNIMKQDKINESEIIEWVQSFEKITLPDEHPNYHYLISNVKGFLRSFYFRIINDEQYNNLTTQIKDTLFNIISY